MKSLYIILLFVLPSFVFSQSNIALEKLSVNLNQTDFFYYVKQLSSDSFKGRAMGSPSYKEAALYVSKQFSDYSLANYGNNSYLQSVPFVYSSLDVQSSSVQLSTENEMIQFELGESLMIYTNEYSKDLNEIKKVVRSAKNALNSAEIKNQLVLITLEFNDIINAGIINKLIGQAIQQGANGILFATKNKVESAVFQSRIKNIIEKDQYTIENCSILHPLMNTSLDFIGFSNHDELLKLGDYENGKNLSLEIDLKFTHQNEECFNVVGVLPGTDPILKDEYIVIGAHLDHLGIRAPIQGDSIYNGMWDNACGVSALMSMANAFSQEDIHLKRSVIFVCYTGEEKGLLGSTYFIENLNLKKGRVVANINLDMIGGIYETRDINPLGYSHSNLSKAVDLAADYLGVKVVDDKHMEQMFIWRSDQAPFLKHKIPVLFMFNGTDAVDPEINGLEYINDYVFNIYHSPFDDVNQEYSKKAIYDGVLLNFYTAYLVCNMNEPIQWNPNSTLIK